MSTAKTIDYVCRRCGSEKTVHEHGSPPDSPVYCCEAEMEIKGKAKGKGRKKASGKKVPSGTPGRRGQG